MQGLRLIRKFVLDVAEQLYLQWLEYDTELMIVRNQACKDVIDLWFRDQQPLIAISCGLTPIDVPVLD
jgi:hypothetical protein